MFNPRDLLKSELIRNTSVLVSGTVLAQLIYLLLQPIIRRLYPVESFGMYSAYISLIGIFSVLTTLRYDDAIVLPGKDKHSANLLTLSVMLGFLLNLFLLVIILIFREQIRRFLPSGFPLTMMYLVPAGSFLLNAYQAFNYWLVRKKKFTRISVNKLIRRSSEGFAQISFSFASFKPGLIFSDIIGQVANVIASISQGIRNGFSSRMISAVKMKYVSRKYAEFPRYSLIPSFMSTYSFLVPALLINKFYSAGNAGLFDASKTLLSVPLALVATSLSSVILQKTSERYNSRESIAGELKNVLAVVVLISLAEVAAMLLFGPWLFKTIFSSDYEISGSMSRILVWSFVLNFIVSSFSALFYSVRKIKIYSIWQVFYFIAMISLWFFNKLEFFDFLKIYVSIEVTCYTVLIFIMIRMIMNYERGLTQAANR